MIDHPRFNRTAQRCKIEGCTHPVHATGLCRRHYGQIWRRGEVYETNGKAERIPPDGSPRSVKELERELRRLKHHYDNAFGLPARMFWRKQIDAIKEALNREASGAGPKLDGDGLGAVQREQPNRLRDVQAEGIGPGAAPKHGDAG